MELYQKIRRLVGPKVYIYFSLVIFTSLCETIGISLFVPLFETILSNGSGEKESRFLTFIDFELFGIKPISQDYIMVTIFLVFMFKGLLLFCTAVYSHDILVSYMQRVRKSFLSSFRKKDYSEISKKNAGFYVALANEHVTRSSNGIGSFANAFSAICSMITHAAMGIYLSWQLGSLVLIFSVCVLGIFKLLNRITSKYSHFNSRELSKLNHSFVELLETLKYIFATNQLNAFNNRVNASTDEIAKNGRLFGRFRATSQAVREPLGVILVLLTLLYFSGSEENIESVIVAAMLFYKTIVYAISAQTFLQRAMEQMSSVVLIYDEFEGLEKPTDVKSEEILPASLSLKEKIVFNNVSLSRGNTPILEAISGVIEKNKYYAVVGESGSGKTTFADMVCGLYLPSSGRVLIDGKDIEAIDLEAWRNQISYISQEVAIYEGSIIENIALGRNPNTLSSQEWQKVYAAVHSAGLADFIASIPDGYNAKVKADGVQLSGGQRQRLCIAREFFRDSDIYIFDEATSALDSENEKIIASAIDHLSGTKTIIQISHKIKTITKTDHVFVFEKGCIVEMGSTKILLKDKSSRLLKLFKSVQGA